MNKNVNKPKSAIEDFIKETEERITLYEETLLAGPMYDIAPYVDKIKGYDINLERLGLTREDDSKIRDIAEYYRNLGYTATGTHSSNWENECLMLRIDKEFLDDIIRYNNLKLIAKGE